MTRLTTNECFVIEVSGSYYRKSYEIKRLTADKELVSFNGRAYRNEMQAEVAAASLGINIHKIGTAAEILGKEC